MKVLAGQFFRYLMVAGGSAVADWLVFVVLNLTFANPVSAQMISRIVGGLFSFSLNRSWGFPADGRHLTVEGRRFLLLYGISYTLSIGILFVGVVVFGFSEYPTKLFADASCFLFNFLMMRIYVFHGRTGLSGRMLKVFERVRKSP